MHMRCSGQGHHSPHSPLRPTKMTTMPEAQWAQSRKLRAHSESSCPYQPIVCNAVSRAADMGSLISRELSHRPSSTERVHELMDRPVGSSSCSQGELADGGE
eukprot:4731369-Heterocapsa_arctica.AAC.1